MRKGLKTLLTSVNSTATGAKILNGIIAASPWIIAATAATALAVGIYKLCSESDDAAKAQGRLNGIMATLNKEVATEYLTLDNLLTPLNKAREGTEEWQKAKNNIVAKYGGYLDKMGIEITNADTARKAYDKLSEAIINSARARAMESATAGAADVYTGKEAETIKNMRERLYGNKGSGDGKISSQEAGKAMGQIMLAVRSGKNIPKEARDILSKLETVWTDPEGFAHRDNFVANYIYQSISDIRKAKENYEKELATAKAMFGGGQDLLSTSNAETNTNDTTNGTVTIEPRVELESAEGSLSALEAKLSELKEKQQKAPLEEIITFSVDIAKLESDIANAKSIIDKTNFQVAYPVRPANLDATPVGGIATASSLELGIKDGGLKDMKLEPMNFDIQDPLTDMERWNEAVGLAREKNQELTDNIGAVEDTARKNYLFFACLSSFLRRFSSSFCRSLSSFSRASFSRSCCNSSRAFSASSRLFCAEAFIFCSNLLSCGGSFLEVSLLDSIPPMLHAPIAPSMRQISII